VSESATAPHGPFLTIAQVAALLGVNERTVRRRIAAGQLPAVQLGGRRSQRPDPDRGGRNQP
jgi:excisionase family DNA binding protein